VASGQRLAICLYRNSSVRVAVPEGTAAPTQDHLAVQNVPKEVVERVKQMIVEGKRAEALQFYAERAAVSPAEAEAAITRLTFSLVGKLTHQMPLSTGGLLSRLAFTVVVALGMAWSIWRAVTGSLWLILLAAVLGFILYTVVRWMVPKVISMWVFAYGEEAQAKILKTAVVVSSGLQHNASIVVALMEVRPQGGQPVFRDEEPWLVGEQSLRKLQPGHVIRVRYDRRTRDRVFPITPVEVVETEDAGR
jgi:hypothetical protein